MFTESTGKLHGRTLDPIEFKLDTAADVTMLPAGILKEIKVTS